MPTLRLAPASTEDYRRLAEKRLPRFLFDYIDGGAYDEQTLGANANDLRALKVKQRVMRDVSHVSTRATLFGRDAAMPAALAPIGLSGMTARRGEVQAKRAADAVGLPFCLSTVSICSMEEIAAVSDTPFWFQLYMLRDRGAVRELLERAKAVGVTTLVFTVDLAVVGARYRDVRNAMSSIDGAALSLWQKLRSGLVSYLLHPDWLRDVGISGKPHTFGNLSAYVPKATTPTDFKEWVDGQFDPSVTWADIEWLRGIWDGDLVIKGVLCAEDAMAARDAGADGVVVSNHGGRQLDGVPSTISVLPRIADALGQSSAQGKPVSLFMDGGVRSGLDIVRAKACGADGVFIGRPWVYALAGNGEHGVTTLLKTFRNEMTVAMALTGVTSIGDIDAQILEHD